MTTKTEAPPESKPDVEPAEKSVGEQMLERRAKADLTPPQDQVIDLDAREDELLATHGGKQYRVRSVDEFGIRDQHRLSRRGKQFWALYESEAELTEDEEQRLEFLLNEILGQVLDAPATVKRRLTDAQKVKVVLGFTQAPVLRVLAAAAKARVEVPELTSGS